jgi:hypothetical protein
VLALQHSHIQQLRSLQPVHTAAQHKISVDTPAADDVSRRQLLAAATAAAVALSSAASLPAQADDFTRTASGLQYLDVREGNVV